MMVLYFSDINMSVERRRLYKISNNLNKNRSSLMNESKAAKNIELDASIHCSRCECHKTETTKRPKRRVRKIWTPLSSVAVVVGILLVQQAAQVMATTLQHRVPGAGGRDTGDPAPGRSPGPPFRSNPPMNFQRPTVSPAPSRAVNRHWQELYTDRSEGKPGDVPSEKSDISRSYARYQSSTAEVSSSSHYREDVTQEYTKATLVNDEHSNPVLMFNGHSRITNPDSSGLDKGHTVPVSREANDDDTRSWHQGGILDGKDDDVITISENNPTVILSSDTDKAIALTSSADFSSYEEQETNNETASWCGGGVKADVEVATDLWVGLINVTVLHPLFRTDYGLVRGVTYQVGVWKSNTVEDVQEVFLLSEVDGRPYGRFVSVWAGETCPAEEWSVIGHLDGVTSVTFNWSADVTSTEQIQRSKVTFRLRFRPRSSKMIIELQRSVPLLGDCQLSLWPTRTNVSWKAFPRQTKDCQVFFPGSTAAETDRRGLVVELTRLNVPCPAGDFLQFSSSSVPQSANSSAAQKPTVPSRAAKSRHQQLCGKLEELPPSGRRFYFPASSLSSATSSVTPSLHLHGNPIFAFTYRLVDYCYNVTLTSKNDTLLLRPTAGLHCTFRIHLPYGNRISLHLQTGEVRLLSAEEHGRHTSEHHPVTPQGSHQDLALTQLAYSDPDPPCSGMLTRLWDGASTWAHCTRKGDPRRDIRVLSRENSVTLRVVIHQESEQSGQDTVNIPALKLWYHAQAIAEVVEQCGFGWVSVRQFCVTAVEDLRLPWQEAEMECNRRGGHLASIRSELAQDLVDNMLLNSPGYRDHNSYWVGASDKTYEGDFRWSDGLAFSYTNWFPGWTQHSQYNRQPNDDGYSDQDCVELRRVYHLPSGNQRLAHSFMWNDRDCATPNLFLCERLRTGVTIKEVWPPECNRSVTLSREQPRVTVVSPGFPHQYPDNAKCDTEVTAHAGYRLLVDFEELVLEKEPYCSYDYLEIFESVPGSNSSGEATQKLCGDWSSKLKLLRYVSRGPQIRLRFVSDYSHHYGGFKAKVSMENGMECADDRLEMFNGSCYLFVSYPEVTWQTAQQICQGMKAELASIHSKEEEDFVISNIRDSTEYSTSAIYWLGGQLVAKSIHDWEWVDGSHFTFSAWLPGQTPADSDISDSSSYSAMCLGIQWMPSPTPAFPSGLYWQSQNCNAIGGYVCKRGNQVSGSGLQLNQTLNGTEGFLSSPNFPGNYYHNLDYWVQLTGPERTRLVVQFQHLDLEPQNECLYDFVELTSIGGDGQLLNDAVRWCGNHHSETDRFNFVSVRNKAVLRFHSDYSVAGTGFSATWQAVDISGCPSQTLTAREGTLMSPNYPHFLMAHLDCATTILAPAGRRVWLQFLEFDFGLQHDSGRDLQLGEQVFSEAVLEIDVGGGNGSFQPFQVPGHLTDGAYLSVGERLHVRLRTAGKPRGIGFKAAYRTVGQVHEERLVDLSNVTVGTLLHLNYPKPPPPHVEFLQHLVAPVGYVILLELYHMTLTENRNCPGSAGIIEVTDNYADTNGTWWFLCEAATEPGGKLGSSTLAITSYFNTLYIKQKSGSSGVQLNATVKVYPDSSYALKLVRGSEESSVESCHPNPCLNGGKCVSRGSHRTCQCTSHFTGMFCALTLCEVQPCAFGQCKLTPTSYVCTCLPSYTGSNCEQKLRPCAENPCEGRGECFEKGETFHCRCYAWWEGQRCERRMLHIPFKPLSERMLHEPFWLGLITVTVVLGVIGLFWCAKRHFPEKLEKLLEEEPDRSRTGYSSHSRPPSVREQLAAAGGATVVVVPSPQPGCPRSLFGRLGIRKPSLLSLTSPHGHNNHQTSASATSRTFSLDDLLKPPPRRTPSPHKKRNNSTPTKRNISEKKQILQQLITPSANQHNPRKVSLGELIQLSERKMKQVDKEKEGGADGEETETTFSTAVSDSQSAPSTAAMSSIDTKFEKKVTFARLLSKVSAEMSSGSEVEGNQTRHPQLSGLPRSNSTPPSPATDGRSPHSTSSNQGSDSMSSLDTTLPLLGCGQTVTEVLANRRPNRLLQQTGRPVKNPSADSILAMFRNFSSATSGSALHKTSSSTTPTASSPQDDAAGSDESSTSSVPTPVSSSSFTIDSPPLPHPFYRHNSNTIEVPVLDALSANKTISGSGNLLQPPTILLEIPSSGINKCLSPIRELPTPLATPSPSPALTPIMPRSAPPYLRSRDDQINIVDSVAGDSVQLPCITITNSDDEEEEEEDEVVAIEVTDKVSKCESYPTASAAPDESEETKAIHTIQLPLPFTMNVSPPLPCNSFSPVLVVDDDEVSAGGENSEECSGGETGCCDSEPVRSQPVIPLLTIQQPSPTHHVPSIYLPGSPPPQRGGHMETSFPFPGKGPRRLLKELDKPNSLDLPCPPPLITITCNMSEAESDTESISPAAKTGGVHLGVPGGSSVGMCYLSPFSMCSRADRTASESNLSSSGYSSMASPGPSRCGSNNPLCPSEVEDPPGSGCAPGTTILPGHSLTQRKPSPLLRTPEGTTCSSQCEVEAEKPPESHGLQGGHCRGRSDSETLSDDLFLESNDEGIGTDHLDEKIEEGELKSAKELEVFIGKDLLENGKTLLGLPLLSASPVTKFGSVDTGLDCCKLLAPSSIHSSKSSLQLPAIVVQGDPGGCEKHLSPVSSRSESPLSDKMGGLGRFSPLFYGRHKSDQLPFTDSDGLYDCPSSDCPLNRVQGNTTAHHRKSTGRRRERRSASRAVGGNKTPSPTKVTTFLDVPGKEQYYRPTAPRKPSPKRSRTRTQPRISSSSSSESVTSTRELHSSSEKIINPDRVSWPSPLTGQTDLEWGNDSKGQLSVEASGEDTGEEVTSQMLPKIMTHDELPKPHRKVSRLRTIGHQIRFLQRLESSLKRRERLVSPSDSCGEDDDDAEGSPQSRSPLLGHHRHRQYEQDIHKSDGFSQLNQPPSRSGRSHQRGAATKQKHGTGAELLLPPEDRAWHHVRMTGCSGCDD